MQKINQNILDILKQCTVNGLHVTINSTLDRKTYVALNKVLETLGGTWNKKLKVHVFQDNPALILDQAINEGSYFDSKKEYQQFFTPIKVAKQLIEMAEISDNHLVLEPSAGSGNILNLLTGKEIHFCEIDKTLSVKLEKKYKFVCDDFLNYKPDFKYDRIVANPPFTKGQEIDHVMHMIDCCKNGGRIITVMSNGITFKTDKKTIELKNRLNKCAMSHMIKNEDCAFEEAGTKVSTIILVIDV
jgi:hypothetical protein